MLTLYGHGSRTAANILKIRAALAEAGAEYQYVIIDLSKGEQQKPEYLAINPHGKVPVLVDDDFALPESDAILWYVAEKFPQAGMMPSDPKSRARVLQWCDFASTCLYVHSYEIYLHTSWAEPQQRSTFVAERARTALDRGLAVLEKRLAGSSHVAGDSFTIADYANAAVLHMLITRGQIDVSAWPKVWDFYGRISARPAWKKALLDTP